MPDTALLVVGTEVCVVRCAEYSGQRGVVRHVSKDLIVVDLDGRTRAYRKADLVCA